MNLKCCLTGILLLFMKAEGQEIKPLSIGDGVPSININTIFNYPALQSNLSAFANKLIILDFMATNCIGCIHVLPRFDSIQKKFGDKVKIILVTYEKKEKVIKFLSKHPELKLPVIGEDTILKKHFPHTFISHEVWIKNGIVKAITEPDYVTANNVETLLAANTVNWPVKVDELPFDYSTPLLLRDPQPISYSLLLHSMNGVPPNYILQRDSTKIRTTVYNYPILNLYYRSYGLRVYPPGFIVLEVKDTSRYVYDKNDRDWRKKFTYCYESEVAAGTDAGKKLRNDLDSYFGLYGRIEKRKIPCKVVKLPAAVPAFISSSNISLANVLSQLNSRYYKIPFIDASGFKGKIYMDPCIDILNEEEIVKLLKKQGFEITTEPYETEVFVLSEINY